MSFLINKYFFTIGNLVFKKEIGIQVGIDSAPLWPTSFLTFLNLSILNNSSQMYLLKHINIGF